MLVQVTSSCMLMLNDTSRCNKGISHGRHQIKLGHKETIIPKRWCVCVCRERERQKERERERGERERERERDREGRDVHSMSTFDSDWLTKCIH